LTSYNGSVSALTYRPALTVRLDGGIEQTFDANVVHVDDEVAAFGELVPDPDRGLPYGTVVHSLLVHLGEQGAEQIEFNDQGNSVPSQQSSASSWLGMSFE
jgi:hypothetical protein